MKSVGIDIGSTSIKVAEVNQAAKGLVVTNFQEYPIGQKPGFDASIEILEILRSIASQYNPEQWKIVAGLRQQTVSVRNKIFPFSDRIKILKSLPFELEEDLPFSPENAVYDAKIVAVMGNSAEVLACAAPKNRVTETLSLTQDAGIEVSILSCEGVALANCWERWAELPAAQAATQILLDGEIRPERHMRVLLNIGHSQTLVCAFAEDRLVGVRTILWGGKNLTESLMKKYELPYLEALNIMQNKAFILLNQENTSYDQIVFSEAVATSFRDLVRDVQMTILEFQSEFNGRVDVISLTGGLSHVQNLHAFLTQQLEVPVNPVSILSGNFTVGFQVTSHMDAICGVALGLAIEGLKKPRNPALNFMKGEFQKQNRKFQELWEKWGSLTKLAIAAFVIFTIYSMVREQLTSSLTDKSAEALKVQAKNVAKLPTKMSNEAGVRKFLKEQHQRSQDLKALQSLAHMNSALDVLRKISESSPGKNSISLTVKFVNIQNNHVQIEGSVARPQDVTALQNALMSMATNGKIETLRTRAALNTSGGVPFAFGFNVDRGMSTK